MGLFSSSYKYYAYSGSANLFEEAARPTTVKSNIVQSVTTEGGLSTSNAITFALQTDLYARAKSMISYANKPDGYKWKFPTTNQTNYNITLDMLRPFIEAEAGAPIDYRTMHIGSFSNIDRRNFWLEKAISDNYLNTSYFPWIPAIGNPVDTNWSPVDTTVEIPVENPTPGGSYWESNNEYLTDIVGTTYHVRFPYNTPTEYWNVAQGFDLGGYDNGENWIQVRYRRQGFSDEYLYWHYQIGSNAIPALESEIQSASINAQYLPIAIMMHDTKWFDEAGDQDWEDTLDRLLRDLAMDPYEIKEDFLTQQAEDDASGDGSKSNAQTWDFFIHFNVPLKTQDRGGREYLFRFYQFLRQSATWTTFDEYQAWLAAGALGDQPATNFSVEEGVEYTGYIARYGWSYITEVTLAGSFTPPGWPEPLRAGRYWSDTLERTDPSYATWLEMVHGGTFSAPGGGGTYLLGPSGKIDGQESNYTFIVRMNTDNTHTIILMMGPGMEYQINTSQDPVGVGSGGYVDYRYRFVDCELFPDDPEQDSEFRWPVHIGSIKNVSAVHREAALSNGLCSTVFLVEEVKVKWYQKGFFKWLIIIIAVILIVLSILFPGFLAAAAFLLAGALGGGLLAFYIIYTILMFAVGWLITTAGQLIGGTWGTVFAVVGMLLVGARGGLNGAPGGAGWGISTQGVNGFASATSFINTTYPYLNGGLQIIQAFEMQKLQDEMEDFLSTAREKYERLRDAWDMLGDQSGNINPINLSARMADWYVEMPENYYMRSLNANPGTLGYDLIQNFTEMATMLPKTPGSPQVVDSMIETFAKQRGQT